MRGMGPEPEQPLRERVERFVARNFPQIAAHGGNYGVEGVDEATGTVYLALGGACTGCGISPMTASAIELRLPREIPEVTRVVVSTDEAPRPDLSDVPF
jgi:Fe-S cluster biogenesis protein NfuA